MKVGAHWLVAAAFALSATAIAACGGGSGSKTATPATSGGAPSAAAQTPASGGGEQPSIKILAPAANASVDGDEAVVQVAVSGLKLDGTKIGQPASQTPGVGHWHIYVDGKYAGLSVSDVIAIPNDAMPQIAAGTHEVKVQLHHTDHTPITPEATDTIMVNFPQALSYAAGSGGPSIDFVSPADGTNVGSRAVFRVKISGLTLDGTKIGQPASQTAGVGHWHIYVDGKYAGLSVSDVISLPNDAMPQIAPGPHEIKIQLHHTDHTPLTPEVSKTETVTFQ
jgi:hypothetical protein